MSNSGVRHSSTSGLASSGPVIKRKRSQPGRPDPDAEVVALSPQTLLATNRYICEICNKGFQRDQNLQLHKRGHNLPWNLKKTTTTGNQVARKKVYVCPETSCVHHDPARALGDLTGIKKHYCRKHCDKKWQCSKCPRKYAVKSDWKAHSKTCGKREYICSCGSLFSRRESYKTHKSFCEASASEKGTAATNNGGSSSSRKSLRGSSSRSTSEHHPHEIALQQIQPQSSHPNDSLYPNNNFQPYAIKQEPQQQTFSLTPPIIAPGSGAPSPGNLPASASSVFQYFSENPNPDQTSNPNIRLKPAAALFTFSPLQPPPAAAETYMSATGLLQKATEFGPRSGGQVLSPVGVLIRPYLAQVPAGDYNRVLTTGFGLNLSSLGDEAVSGYGSGSKSSVMAGSGTDLCAPAGLTMYDEDTGKDEDRSVRVTNMGKFGRGRSSSGGGDGGSVGAGTGDDDNVTRDFLGLKAAWK